MKEITAIKKLIEMYNEGYLGEELDDFIDCQFDYIETDNKVLLDGNEVINPILREIVKLSNSIYYGEEMDKLLEKLSKES